MLTAVDARQAAEMQLVAKYETAVEFWQEKVDCYSHIRPEDEYRESLYMLSIYSQKLQYLCGSKRISIEALDSLKSDLAELYPRKDHPDGDSPNSVSKGYKL